MTEKRARALHRAMWRWLAKHPGASKNRWPGWWDSEEMREAYSLDRCFACFVAKTECNVCPITEKAKRCSAIDALWQQFVVLRRGGHPDPVEWADVCNRMADAWREIPEGR